MRVDPFDLVAFLSLAVLVLVFGLAPASAVMRLWIRMRHQVVLIWTVPCLRRGADLLGLRALSTGLHQVAGFVPFLVACWVLHFFWREARHAGRPL